jgi:hypothetical protein
MGSRLLAVLLLVACASPPHTASNSTPSIPSGAAQAWTRGPRDSVRAVALACALMQELRAARPVTTCRVESFQEEADAFAIRVVESAPKGRQLDFHRSEVRLPKEGTGVTVSRIPEL